ncbi:DUF7344 domain-containing protein [Halococcus thailandensis]|uniref:DUF7344 domain-containing protein n=1 Tax=Halococcus thailandensis JCM 13552 TaxID=1227457 RepID=M0NEE7_9EURY|nr:hypothetical protein [Halococcus thailandensis]EMA56362.1 hypothetical protein C451_02754 [Halococcus thailandensis JCM 13552]
MTIDLPETPAELLRFFLHPVTEGDLNEYYHLLSNRRRRLVIARVFVLDPGGSIEVKPLARQIAGVEAGTDPGAVPGSKYDAVYNGLIQSHLSALANAGIIVYEPDRKRVRRGPAIHAAVVMLAATIMILRFLGLQTRDESSR